MAAKAVSYCAIPATLFNRFKPLPGVGLVTLAEAVLNHCHVQSQLLENLDQVEIRVAYVHGTDRACRTGSLNRALNNWPMLTLKVLDNLFEADTGDEAQIQCSRNRQMGFWLELMPPHMNIDLLIAVTERETFLA